ncbi:metabotropic glutamate receptor-like [Centruroides vittatus]|uniref:metabotropic glutamate receptor-like n=1 Tax=Centruroides vittatus TaxID=120091 RepID=UPI003510515E
MENCSGGVICLERNSTESSIQMRSDLWVVPLLIVSSINVLVITVFEIFVLYKAYGTNPNRRHLFLGQMLLLGLFLCSSLGFAFVPRVHWISCSVIRLGLGLSYALVFSTLMVKCVFLLSLSSGVYLPPGYQGLLLFFAMAVQIVISIQGYVQRPSDVIVTDGVAKCSTSMTEHIYSLLYIVFLILIVALLAIKARGLRENHRESMFIGIAVGLSIPMWCAWIAIPLTASNTYYDPYVAFGIVCNATMVFLVMFLPKGRQLAAMGREGLYPEDRDEFSSPYQSIYTSSFLHVKPPPMSNQGTLIKPAVTPTSQEGIFYFPSPPTRVWRYGHPAKSPVLPGRPEDSYFYPGERTFSCNPNVKFYRGPLY